MIIGLETKLIQSDFFLFELRTDKPQKLKKMQGCGNLRYVFKCIVQRYYN